MAAAFAGLDVLPPLTLPLLETRFLLARCPLPTPVCFVLPLPDCEPTVAAVLTAAEPADVDFDGVEDANGLGTFLCAVPAVALVAGEGLY